MRPDMWHVIEYGSSRRVRTWARFDDSVDVDVLQWLQKRCGATQELRIQVRCMPTAFWLRSRRLDSLLE